MKRFLSVFTIILLSISMIFVPVQADGMSIVATDVTTAAGQDFAVDIKIENNVGIWGTALDLSFDTEHFSVKEVRNAGEIFSNGELMIGPADFSQGFVRVFGNNNALSNKTSSGTIVSVIFTCHKDAPKNTFEFTLSHRNSDPANTCNVEEETVSVTLVSATVTVGEKNKAPQPTTQKGKDLFADKGGVIAQAVNGSINSVAVENDVITQKSESESKTDKKDNASADSTDEAKKSADNSDKTDDDSKDNAVAKSNGADKQESPEMFNLLYFFAALVVIAIIAIIIVNRVIKK